MKGRNVKMVVTVADPPIVPSRNRSARLLVTVVPMATVCLLVRPLRKPHGGAAGLPRHEAKAPLDPIVGVGASLSTRMSDPVSISLVEVAGDAAHGVFQAVVERSEVAVLEIIRKAQPLRLWGWNRARHPARVQQ